MSGVKAGAVVGIPASVAGFYGSLTHAQPSAFNEGRDRAGRV